MCLEASASGFRLLPGNTVSVSRDLMTPSVLGHAGPVKRPAGAHAANQRGDGQADPLQLPQGRVSAFP